METPEWIEQAPCAGKAQFMWYPPWEAKDPNAWYEMGRVVCGRLAWTTDGMRNGVCGGDLHRRSAGVPPRHTGGGLI